MACSKAKSSRQSSGRHDCAHARVKPPRSTLRPCGSAGGVGTTCSDSVPATRASPLHGATSSATDVRSHSDFAVCRCFFRWASNSAVLCSSGHSAAACAHCVVSISQAGLRRLRCATPSHFRKHKHCWFFACPSVQRCPGTGSLLAWCSDEVTKNWA